MRGCVCACVHCGLNFERLERWTLQVIHSPRRSQIDRQTATMDTFLHGNTWGGVRKPSPPVMEEKKIMSFHGSLIA